MLGTIINVITVAAGSSAGLLLKDRLPQSMTKMVFTALGLFTIFMGISMGLESSQPLVLVLSLIIGSMIGQAGQLDERSIKLVEAIRSRSLSANAEAAMQEQHTEARRFAEGLMTAFVLFCIGSMTVLGCMQEGISGDREVILTKAFMDLFSSMALAAAFGRGVLFSVIPLFLYQAGLTLGAEWLKPILNMEMTAELYGCGGVLLIGLGLNILELTKIKMLNMLPALLVAPILAWIVQQFGSLATAILSF